MNYRNSILLPPDIPVNELGVVSLPYSTNQCDLERDKEEIPLESKELQLSLTPQDLWQTGLQYEQR